MPRSRTEMTTSSPSFRAESRMCPPFSLYLAALFRRFTTTCSSRVGSTFDPEVPAVDRELERVLPLLDERPRPWRRHSSRIGVRSSTSRLQLDLAAADAGDVQQVVDEPRQVLHLPGDDLHRPVDVLLEAAPCRELHGVADGRQRVPQLVGEHGEELVLPPVVASGAPRRASRSRWRWPRAARAGRGWPRRPP